MTGLNQFRPNIVWILSDQHQAEAIGGNSHGVVQTPNLDALIGEGTSFESAYCQGPLCVPSRASLLTQRYVSDHRVKDNTWTGGTPGLPTTVQQIRDAGYHTAGLGKMHLSEFPADVADAVPIMRAHGFVEVDEVLGKYGNSRSRSPYTDYLAERGFLDGYRDFLDERDPQTRPNLSDLGLVGKPHWSTDSAPMPADAHPDAWLGRRAAEWISRYNDEDPFFLWVGFPGPHDPWDAPGDYVDRYRNTQIPLPRTLVPPVLGDDRFAKLVDSVADYGSSASADLDTIREVRRHYYAGVTMIDDSVGLILSQLEERNLLDNTWVIYTSDHGEMLGTHGLFTKTLFYESSVKVPLIVRPPGGQDSRSFDGLVEHIDLAATLCELAGADPVPGTSGHSFAAILHGGTNWERDTVRSECEGFGMWRTSSYKLVVDEEDLTPVQLFDLRIDPLENVNLIDNADCQHIVAELMRTRVLPDLRVQEA
ncbi:MAG: sulfatase family protein [Actinomycetes bacterium]